MEDWVEQPGGVDSYFPTRALSTAQSLGPLYFIILSKTTTWCVCVWGMLLNLYSLMPLNYSTLRALHPTPPTLFFLLVCFVFL